MPNVVEQESKIPIDILFTPGQTYEISSLFTGIMLSALFLFLISIAIKFLLTEYKEFKASSDRKIKKHLIHIFFSVSIIIVSCTCFYSQVFKSIIEIKIIDKNTAEINYFIKPDKIIQKDDYRTWNYQIIDRVIPRSRTSTGNDYIKTYCEFSFIGKKAEDSIYVSSQTASPCDTFKYKVKQLRKDEAFLKKQQKLKNE